MKQSISLVFYIASYEITKFDIQAKELEKIRKH